MRKNGYNAIVTCGGIHSNHNRAIALMAMINDWKCHLAYHGLKSEFENSFGNANLVRISGASYEFVNVNEISKAMDKAMASFEKKGLNLITFMEVGMICLEEKRLSKRLKS